MADYEVWAGASGRQYQFGMVRIGDAVPTYGGVYIVARAPLGLAAALMGQRREALYVGSAQNLFQRACSGLEQHHKWPAFQAAKAQFMGVYLVSDKAERERIEVDLIQGLRPILNETHNAFRAFGM